MIKCSEKIESDSTLLKQLKSGNINLEKQAFEKIYKRYYKLVYFRVGGFVESKEDVEDIVQEIFLRLYNQRYEIIYLKTFLLTSAKYCGFNSIKTKKSDAQLVDLMELDIEVDSINQHSEIYTQIMGAINRVLDKEDSELVLNHVLYEIPLKILAQEYNENYSSIRCRYRRAIKRLKKEVRKKWKRLIY